MNKPCLFSMLLTGGCKFEKIHQKAVQGMALPLGVKIHVANQNYVV